MRPRILRHMRKFLGKENLAQIRNPVLRDKDDAVAPRVGRTEIKNLNFLAAEEEGHAITKGLVRQPRPLLFGGRAAAFHLVEKAGSYALCGADRYSHF